MRRPAVIALVLAVLLLLGFGVGGPLLALRGLQQAILSKDQAAIERYVDFPKVRENLTAQLSARLRHELDANDDNALGRLGAMFAGGIVNQLVNRIVTPEGLANFGADAMGQQKGSVNAVRDWRVAPQWPLGLRIYNSKNPKSGLVMELQGLSWKVVRLDLG